MVRDSTAGSSNSASGGNGNSSSNNNSGRGTCICFIGFMIVAAAITGGVVSAWPTADRSKGYTDRTVREAIVPEIQTAYVHLDDQFQPKQIQKLSVSTSMNHTGDAISITSLPHNMELVSYCYTQSQRLVRCDMYFNNPGKFEYWKEGNQCLAYTIGAPKTQNQDHQCSFLPQGQDSKTSSCVEPNQIHFNVCEQQVSWNSTTCFKSNDKTVFTGKIDMKNTRYTDTTFFQTVKILSSQDYPILQELVLGRSVLTLHSVTNSSNETGKRDGAKSTAICSNGVPGNGPQQNYKPVEESSIGKADPSSPSNKSDS